MVWNTIEKKDGTLYVSRVATENGKSFSALKAGTLFRKKERKKANMDTRNTLVKNAKKIAQNQGYQNLVHGLQPFGILIGKYADEWKELLEAVKANSRENQLYEVSDVLYYAASIDEQMSRVLEFLPPLLVPKGGWYHHTLHIFTEGVVLNPRTGIKSPLLVSNEEAKRVAIFKYGIRAQSQSIIKKNEKEWLSQQILTPERATQLARLYEAEPRLRDLIEQQIEGLKLSSKWYANEQTLYSRAKALIEDIVCESDALHGDGRLDVDVAYSQINRSISFLQVQGYIRNE